MHFTYSEPTAGADLQQGDVIKRTEKLDAVIGKYHTYYLKSDYTHFLVLTQSCDLTRREGLVPSAPYVSLAAIRPLSVVLKKEANKHLNNELLRLADAIENSKRQSLRNFVRTLLNNNQKDYFYLHGDPQIYLEDSCAFLRLAVSIRCEEHYSSLIESRVVSLDKEFQAKLGWLVGNLYSRVATDDWTPTYRSQEEWDQIVEKILDGSFKFVDDLKAKKAKKDPSAKALSSREEARAFIDNVRVDSKREEAIAVMIDVLTTENLLEGSNVEIARRLLKNTPQLSAFFKS